MDREFLAQFLTETHFPAEAADFLLGAYAALGEKASRRPWRGRWRRSTPTNWT